MKYHYPLIIVVLSHAAYCASSHGDTPYANSLCCIEVVEKGSDWPIPLVHLRTTHGLRFVTDNTGVIAIDAPELFDRDVFFHVEGHGYEAPKDGFGYRGIRIKPQRGKTIRVELRRTIIAKRLGRITGAGLFAESQKLGDERKWQESGVTGCDSVQTAVYQGRRFWLWGDTNLYHYPLGVFHSTAATTSLRPLPSLKPPARLKFDYFTDQKGRPRAVAKMPGDGPTWLSGMTTVSDSAGNERLVATYFKIRPPLEPYEIGLSVWNDQAKQFDRLRVIWTQSAANPKPPPVPAGHATPWLDENGDKHLLFGNPLPTLSCPATFDGWRDTTEWKPLKPQPAIKSASDNKPITPHTGSIAWNGWRKRWVTVFMQKFGKPSAFGELWYAEADRPTGPWGPAVKILSHNNYTFYNPRLHPELSPSDSPMLLFEGTYTQQFADKPTPTPRYEYNQILYRLDLNDPALKAAQQSAPENDR